MTAAAVRASLVAGLRAAGPDIWLLAIFATTITNLFDFAAVPAPGELPGADFVAAGIVRVLLVFWAGYAIERRMAGAARALMPSIGVARFFLFSLAWLVAYGAWGSLVARGLVLGDRPLATQWLVLLVAQAVWSVATIRLIAIGPGFAMGAPFRDAGRLAGATRGAGLALALAYLQVVLPFAAIHVALTLVGVRLPLTGGALAALALVDGVVSGVQLLVACALAVTAWRMAEPPLRGGGTRR